MGRKKSQDRMQKVIQYEERYNKAKADLTLKINNHLQI